MSNNNQNIRFKLGLVLGAVIGGAAALLLSPRTGKQNRAFVAAKLQQLKKRLDEMEVQEKVQDIFGDVSEQSVNMFEQTRTDLARRLEAAREQWGTMDFEKYTQLVREAVGQVKEKGNVSPEHLSRLKDYLMEDWQKLGQEEAPVKRRRTNGRAKA